MLKVTLVAFSSNKRISVHGGFQFMSLVIDGI